MKYKKALLRLALFLAVLLAVAAFIVENVLPYSGIKPKRHHPEDFTWLLPKGIKPENYGLKGRDIRIQTPDGISLSTTLIESTADSIYATVVLLHGISACKETEMDRAKVLADAGYSSLLVDLRAHGQSGGEYCTFGYYEKDDMRAVADTLTRLFPHRPIAIWGSSLGGAIALQAMALDRRYKFGVVESTFHDFEQVAEEYGSDWFFGLRSRWLTEHVLRKSGQIAHFDPFSIRPVEAAAQIDRPVFFMHGDKDSRIPMWFNQKNYEACTSPQKVWYTVPGGGHSNLWNIAGDSLTKKVFQFLQEVR